MKSHRQQEILMCPPTYYAIEYQINPWMNKQVDHAKALAQWQNLKKAFEDIGMKVFQIEPVKHLPDMVFTADHGAVYDGIFIKSNFRYPQRRRESLYTLHWFQKRGFTIVELPKSAYFEGHGDFLFFNADTILIGVGQRTNRKAVQIIARIFGMKTIPLNLTNPYFYHLDTALCLLHNKTLMLYEKAFDKSSLQKIKDLNATIISLDKADALKMACNSIVYKNHIVINKGCSKKLLKALKARGLSPLEVDLSEFMKSGGGAHCLTWSSKPI